MKWHLYFIMGIAWSWKWTLIKNLKALWRPDFLFPQSYVTRAMRENEVNGEHYFFISQWEFLTSIENNEFLEYAFVHKAWYYGTKLKDVIDEWVKVWKYVFKELEFQWLKKLKSEKPELDVYYSTIFLNIPKEHLKQRIEARWVFMSDEDYKNRMASAELEEAQLKELCDFEIDATLPPEKVFETLIQIIKQHEWM